MSFQQFEIKSKRSSTEDVIIRTLRNYPNITKSMLSAHVRPGRDDWYDVLVEMVDDGIVDREVIIRETGRASVIYKLSDRILRELENE